MWENGLTLLIGEPRQLGNGAAQSTVTFLEQTASNFLSLSSSNKFLKQGLY